MNSSDSGSGSRLASLDAVRGFDMLFAFPERIEGQGDVSDVSGLIGQYAHGNEPSHHFEMED